jgi:cytidyltransferase-like protein
MKKFLLIICVVGIIHLVEAKRVYANMVADLFHYGHVNFLRQAALLGDELVVGIVNDELLTAYKRIPIISQHERAEVVRACRYVHEVIEGTPLIIDEAFMKEHTIDSVVHGSDFTEEKMKYYFPYAYSMGTIVILPYTPLVSTTEIIKRIKERCDLRSYPREFLYVDIIGWL